MSNQAYLNTAILLAREASKYALQSIDRLDRLKIRDKGVNDLVSNIDEKIDQFISFKIKELYPDHNILSEESGFHNQKDDSEFLWVVDPIDGTKNFISGIPLFAISIALLQNNEPIVGVVYLPMTDELFEASINKGAMLNRVRIKTTQHPINTQTMAVCLSKKHSIPTDIPSTIKQKFPTEPSYRALGSAAISLVYQATGRYQVFYGKNLKIWDIAAGILIAREAGSIVHYKTSQENIVTEITSGHPDYTKLSL